MVGLVGAGGALVFATALSPLAPLGEGRAPRKPRPAWSSTRRSFCWGRSRRWRLRVPLGCGQRFGQPEHCVPMIGRILPARLLQWRTWRGWEAPPSAMIGVRNALERRKGGAAVPVGSTLFGIVLAVVALCGTAVFGASLSHLTATPKLYGDPFQLNLNTNGGPSDPALLRSLEHDQGVAQMTAGTGSGEISVNKVLVGAVSATAVRGPLLFSTVDGQLPRPRSPNRLGRDDHASGRCAHWIGRPCHLDGAVGCYSYSVVPGGLSDFLPRAGRNRQPGYRRAVHEYWLRRRAVVPSGSGRAPRANSRRWGVGSWPASCRVHGGGRLSITISTRTRQSPLPPSFRHLSSTSARRSISLSSLARCWPSSAQPRSLVYSLSACRVVDERSGSSRSWGS